MEPENPLLSLEELQELYRSATFIQMDIEARTAQIFKLRTQLDQLERDNLIASSRKQDIHRSIALHEQAAQKGTQNAQSQPDHHPLPGTGDGKSRA